MRVAQHTPDGTVVHLHALPERPSPLSAATVEQRMAVLEEQARGLGEAVDATRAIMAIVEQRLAKLNDLQAGVARLRSDLDADSRAARHRIRAKSPCPLSARELEVLAQLADGKVYKQIARELALSVSTVRSHLHHTYAKLGVIDRAQAVLLASDRGWI